MPLPPTCQQQRAPACLAVAWRPECHFELNGEWLGRWKMGKRASPTTGETTGCFFINLGCAAARSLQVCQARTNQIPLILPSPRSISTFSICRYTRTPQLSRNLPALQQRGQDCLTFPTPVRILLANGTVRVVHRATGPGPVTPRRPGKD